MNNKRYRLLVMGMASHITILNKEYTDWNEMNEIARLYSNGNWLGVYFLEWEEETPESLTLGTFSNGSWSSLNDAVDLVSQYKEKTQEQRDSEKTWNYHPGECNCVLCVKLREEDFIELLPYEPSQVDEKGRFIGVDQILVANYEVRQPKEKRLQFINEDDNSTLEWRKSVSPCLQEQEVRELERMEEEDDS